MNTTFSSLLGPFLKTIYTTDDANKVRDALEVTLENLYKVHQSNIFDVLLGQVPFYSSDQLRVLIQQSKVDTSDRKAVKEFCQSISKALDECHPLVLKIPSPLSFEAEQKVCNLIKGEFGVDIIIQITIDPNIVGGAVITFKGEYLDFSLKTKIQNYLKTTSG